MNIGIITSKSLKPFLEGIIQDMNLTYSCRYLIYEDFTQLKNIYLEHEKYFDGFLVSGIIVRTIIVKTVKKIEKPIFYFSLDSYRIDGILLDLLVKNRALDLKRVAIDLIKSDGLLADAHYYVNRGAGENNEFFYHSEVDNITGEELVVKDKKIFECIHSLWNDGRIDLVICHLSSIASWLSEYNIPFIISYPDENEVRKTIRALDLDIKCSYLDRNMPAAITVEICALENETNPEMALNNLQKALFDFKNQTFADLLIQSNYNSFTIYTSKKTVLGLTGEYSKCSLSGYLRKALNMNIIVGYGIGMNVNNAKGNSLTAVREAAYHKGVFVCDEAQNLFEIGAFAKAGDNAVSDNVGEYAATSGLSTLMIKRILYLMKDLSSDLITTKDLSVRYDISIRTANRALTKLEQAGYAKTVSTKSPNSKGRPFKVYKINFQ